MRVINEFGSLSQPMLLSDAPCTLIRIKNPAVRRFGRDLDQDQ
jgi:hypothetical protein